MAKQRCEGCAERVRIAGGIGDMWSRGGPSGGMTLEFADESEHFLCFDCIEDLPEEPTDEDVTGVGG